MLGNKLRLWDVATGVVARTLSGKNDSYASVAFSPDGKLLAAGLLSNEVRLWDVATGAVARTLSGHTDSVWSVVFSADGEVLASASSDQTVKVWNVLTGTAIYTLTGQSDGVNSIAFSPDEKLLASSSGRRVKLWDITSVLPGGSQPSSPSGAATPSPTTSLPADVVQLGNYRLRMVPLIKCASAQGRPYTSILISTDGEKDWTIIPDVLLDSGADMSMFPAPVADALGIDLSACQAMTFSGVGGTTTAYLSEVYIAVVHFGGAEADVDGYILSSGGEPFVFKAAATFTSDAANADTYLLGREDVFDYLSLSFQGDTATVTVSER
jgi:WD40 repeat protein